MNRSPLSREAMMSYSVSQLETKFSILEANKGPAAAALHAKQVELATKHKRAIPIEKSLFEYAANYGWKFETQFKRTVENGDLIVRSVGDITDITHNSEGMGDTGEFFDTIAPFVVPGSYVGMAGEDGHCWRWVFENGVCTEVTPTLTW